MVKSRKILFISLLALVFFLSTYSFSASKKALLVGINNYKNLPFVSSDNKEMLDNLLGPLNDVNSLKGLLLSKYGFRSEDVKTLKDSEATRDGILNSIDSWLIKGTKAGDLVFFFFSGHGTQVEDLDGDEEDRLDEAICAYDVVVEGATSYAEAHIILDDELSDLFRKLAGREVFSIFDACHSASVATRSISGRVVSRLEQTPAVHRKYLPVKINKPKTRGMPFSKEIEKQFEMPSGQVAMYSSKEDQVSLEISFFDGFHGVLCSALCEVMGEKNSLSYSGLFAGAAKIIKDRFQQCQDPVIEPQSGPLLEKSIFSLTISVPPEVKKPATIPPEIPGKKEEAAPPQQKPTAQEQAPPVKPNVPLPPPEMKDDKILLRMDPLQGENANLYNDIKNRLSKLAFIKLTEGDFFDRLLRVSEKDGLFSGKLLNRAGDVTDIPARKNVEELIGTISRHLETDSIVKQLARIHHPNPAFGVKVWVTDEKRRDFKFGEKIVFNFKADEDCYILLIAVDSQGSVSLIFPNEYFSENLVKGGETVQIPDENMRKKFELEFGEPPGEETVKVIATKEKLELEKLGLENLKKLFTDSGNIEIPEPSRGIFVRKVNNALSSGNIVWSEDMIVIRSFR